MVKVLVDGKIEMAEAGYIDTPKLEKANPSESQNDRQQQQTKFQLEYFASSDSTANLSDKKPSQASSLPQITIENFGKVDDGLYRGATPTPTQLKELQKLGVHTIIDLRVPDESDFREKGIANELGIKYYNEPLLYNRPRTAEMAKIMGIINDPAQQPVYVHCREGQDRTGTVIGTERRVVDGWTWKDTYKEMLNYGFHPVYKELADFVKNSPAKNLPYKKQQ